MSSSTTRSTSNSVLPRSTNDSGTTVSETKNNVTYVSKTGEGWDAVVPDYSKIELKQLIKGFNNKYSCQLIFDLKKLKFEISNHPQGWSHKSCCPLPDHQDSTPSFFYNPSQNRFKCFGCQRNGSFVQLFSYMQNMTIPEVIHYLTYNKLEETEFVESEDANYHEEIFKKMLDFADEHFKFLENEDFSEESFNYCNLIVQPLDFYVRHTLKNNGYSSENLDTRIEIALQKITEFEGSE